MDKPTNNCFLNLHYPQVSNASDKRKNILESIYRIYINKFVSVSEYIYQNLMFSTTHPIVSDIVECISITELKHFKLLGKLLTSLGINPRIRYTDLNRKSRDSEHASRTNDSELKNFLFSDIYFAKNFIQELNLLSRATNDTVIKALTSRLILDEQHKIELLEELI